MHRRFPSLAAIALALAAVLSPMLPAVAAACSMPGNLSALRADLVQRVNAERRKAGLPALSLSGQLSEAAQGHACDNARRDKLTHRGSDGSSFGQRIKRTGYSYRTANENVGVGMRDPANAVQWWMNSAQHRDNILSRRTREMGVGIAYSTGKRSHWVFVSAGG